MLKKLSVLIVAGILVGCTNIDNLGGKKIVDQLEKLEENLKFQGKLK